MSLLERVAREKEISHPQMFAVPEEAHQYVAVESLQLPEAGQVVHLREFGFVSVFRTVDTNAAARHYAAFDPPKKSA